MTSLTAYKFNQKYVYFNTNQQRSTHQSTQRNLREKKGNSPTELIPARTFVERFGVRSRVKMAPEKGRGHPRVDLLIGEQLRNYERTHFANARISLLSQRLCNFPHNKPANSPSAWLLFVFVANEAEFHRRFFKGWLAPGLWAVCDALIDFVTDLLLVICEINCFLRLCFSRLVKWMCEIWNGCDVRFFFSGIDPNILIYHNRLNGYFLIWKS